MHRYFVDIFILFIAAWLVTLQTNTASMASPNVPSISPSVNEFAFEMLRRLRVAETDRTTFFSPLSISQVRVL
jgi:serine protease inhibitor